MAREQHPITPAQFIRQHILRMKRQDFAEALGVTPTIVSRYEREGKIPARHQERVLKLARERGRRVQLKWFAVVPWDPKMNVPA